MVTSIVVGLRTVVGRATVPMDAAEVEKKTYRESLQNNVERIRMSQRLATIATDVPVEFSVESVKAHARNIGTQLGPTPSKSGSDPEGLTLARNPKGLTPEGV